MRQFDEIISLLSDDKASLASALLKTKVLLRRLGHPELEPWVSDELTGYPREGRVPDYRIVGTHLTGTVETVAQRRTGVTLPTMHLSTALRERLCTEHLGHSVAALEGFAAAKDGTVVSPVPPELYGTLSEAYSSGQITSARSVISSTQIAGVLTEIRSRLLDFLLNLQDTMGDVPEEDMKKAAEAINAREMFNHSIFGPNTTIVVGSHNQTTVSNVAKGDLAGLHKALAAEGVARDDLAALTDAIDKDGALPQQTRAFGPRVGAWIGGMVQKAATGAWQISIGAAGNLLATAIGAYYGNG